MKLVYTAFSKHMFYQRDIISKFVLENDCVPLNPFKNWDYFLADTVDRDLVRNANNRLVEIADEVWQFGEISNGCWFEIKNAIDADKKVRYFKLGKTVQDIAEIKVGDVIFEVELANEINEEEMRKIIETKEKK